MPGTVSVATRLRITDPRNRNYTE